MTSKESAEYSELREMLGPGSFIFTMRWHEAKDSHDWSELNLILHGATLAHESGEVQDTLTVAEHRNGQLYLHDRSKTMTTTDYATPSRLEWLRVTEPRMGARAHKICWPTNGLLAKPINDRADPLVDIELQKRADRAWDAAREMGHRETIAE
jgi:hypothetical protein